MRHDDTEKRGIKSGKQFISKYRSFKTEGDNIYGYKKNGSKQLIARKSDMRHKQSGWGKGFYGTIKKAVKEKATRTRKPTNPYAFKMPSFKLGW
jgi:hypothetical protein